MFRLFERLIWGLVDRVWPPQIRDYTGMLADAEAEIEVHEPGCNCAEMERRLAAYSKALDRLNGTQWERSPYSNPTDDDWPF